MLSVYVTFPTKDEALKLCREAVLKKLAACANIQSPHMAIYEWQGKMEEGLEFAALLKTTEEKYPALEKWLQEQHSYDIPCILAWKIETGSPEFLQWIQSQTR